VSQIYSLKAVTIQVSSLLDSSLPTAAREEYGVGAGCAAAGCTARTHSNSWVSRRRTLLANAIERRFPSSRRATTRVAPTMDGPGEPLHPWLCRGDPRGRPAGSLHALVLLHSHCHSPAKSPKARACFGTSTRSWFSCSAWPTGTHRSLKR